MKSATRIKALLEDVFKLSAGELLHQIKATFPQNEIVKFITGRITQLVMFRKYNKKKRTNPRNPNAGK